MTPDLQEIRESLRRYYGQKLKTASDLAVAACCTDETARRFGDVLRLIPEEVKKKQYGCGSPIPMDDLKGLEVVDFGCGAGTDAFVASKLVGETGRVTGLDMTDEQLDVGRRATPSVMKRFGLAAPNVEFRKDYIEVADTVPDGSVDLVISNCVINLSPRKDLVFGTIHRILREGGELYVSDIVADRRLPDDVRSLGDPYYSECLTGAEYQGDLRDIMEEAGFRDVRIVSRTVLDEKVGKEAAQFYSLTLRGFKLTDPVLDRRCEDYGQFATYTGGMEESPVFFELDEGHTFERDRPAPVCRNTAWMLSRTRLARYFQVTEPVKHFGIFDCAPRTASGEMPPTGCC
ncbi:MAG: methyltransferase domain-containing protein [Planctomycetota bacterium]|nr:methyltransferase domain-containing protein [Planctomycetota bacterium]